MTAKFKLSFTFILLTAFAGCQQHRPSTLVEKVEFYEIRARNYRALAHSQRLSLPYPNHSSIISHESHLGLIYQNEARWYEKMAEETRNLLENNQTGEWMK